MRIILIVKKCIVYLAAKCIMLRFRLRTTQLLAVLVIITIYYFVASTYIANEPCECPKAEPNVQAKRATGPRKKTPPKHRLAVLVPFRDRFEELLEFAPHMRDFLGRQHVDYDIFILNQVDGYRFNRASLINVGYLRTRAGYDYIAMHDVDLLPLNDNLPYAYPKEQPFHVAAPSLHPKYHYSNFVGGILLVNREHFELVNGMSNKYWGWGLEDDEFFVRLREANLNVTRPTNITTGTNDTFRHVHGKHRKRDTTKCFNQREVTRKRDRQTGLHNVRYNIRGVKNVSINDAALTVINIELICDHELTPWCDCSEKKTENGAAARLKKGR